MILSMAHFLHDIYSSFLPPLLPLIISKFNLSLTAASGLLMLQNLPSLLSFFVGAVAHKLPWRLLIILTPLVTAVCGSLIGLAPNLIILALLLVTIGISSALFHVPAPIVIRYYSGAQTGKGMSWYMLGGEGARMLGPVLIVSAVSWWTLEGTWRLIFPAIVFSLLLHFMLERKSFEKIDERNLAKGAWLITLKAYAPFFLGLAFYMLFRSVMKASMATFLPTYLGLKGNSLITGAVALSVLQGSAAVGSFLSGGISDRIGRFKTLIFLALSAPVFMLIFVYSGFALQMVLLVVLGVLLYATSPILLALVLEQGSKQPAMMNAGFTTVNFVTNAIAILSTGFLGDWLGLDTTFKLASILAFGAFPSALVLRHYSAVKS
jgi:FSR family fosmidomycin resistance protein-like MFS transporter